MKRSCELSIRVNLTGGVSERMAVWYHARVVLMSVFRLLMLVLIVMSAGETAGQGGEMLDFRDYRWKNRLLIVAADSEMNPMVQHFRYETAGAGAEIADRDLLVCELYTKGTSRIGAMYLEPSLVQHLRAALVIGDEPFTLVLIGKDGTEKFRSTKDVALSEIFAIIDAMPMRRQEMREKGTPSPR